MSSHILLVEDEPALRLAVADLLTGEGYEVQTAPDGPAGLAAARREAFDLIVLDVMLPGMSGFDVCRDLREDGKQIAILMLTAKSQIADRVAGLKLGADDYLTKPFDPAELLARVEALLRRVGKDASAVVSRFQIENIAIDFDRGEVRKGEETVAMTAKELDLLRYLVERRGNVVSRDELLEKVWDYQAGVSSRTVDVHIAWLRQKLEEQPQTPRYIHTVRGVGYRFSGQ